MKTDDLHQAHAFAVLAILQAAQCAQDRLAPAQLEQLRARVADGSGKFALFVSNDGETVHAELALLANTAPSPFDQSMLVLDGPVASPAAAPGTVALVDRGRLN